MTGSAAGSDVLVQSLGARTCQGFKDVGVSRPARILVRKGADESAKSADELTAALIAALGWLGRPVGGSEMPCHGLLQSECMAMGEARTLNLLAWVGSGEEPGSAEDRAVADWLESRPDAAAVAVVPAGSNPDRAVPPRLRDRQVIWWDGNSARAALDVIAAAQVDAAERRIFVSYSHADGMALAHAVFRTLSEARFAVFLDAFALAPGGDFAERIEHELLDKAFLILIETPRAVASPWVQREIAFARQHRLGIASVSPGAGAPRLAGIGWARRWTLRPGGLDESCPDGPALIGAAAAELRDFVVLRHAEAILRRRRVLDLGLRAALRRAGVSGAAVDGVPGGLEVDAGGRRWDVSLRPRPASLIDMHTASRQTPPGHGGVMVSATPRGRPERDALDWLAAESGIPHWDEGRLLSLAQRLAAGTL